MMRNSGFTGPTPGRVLLVTGVNGGFGHAIASAALAAGDRVFGTVRRAGDVAAFEQLSPDRAHGRVLDLTRSDEVADVVADIEAAAGRVDALIGCAGYCHEGLFEETSIDDLRAQLEVNVIGSAAVIKAVLPGMRAKRRGHIVQITSMSGLMTMPGLGLYQASKFALEGLVETIAREVRPFGIRVTAVAPGGFRTGMLAAALTRGDRSGLADYQQAAANLRAERDSYAGQQPGDPDRAATAILRLLDAGDRAPLHLLLGSDALDYVRRSRARQERDFAEWEWLSRSTDLA